jgi:SSS family transporter
MNPVVYGIFGYILVQLAIGVYVSRRIATEDDYLVAGRSLGPWVATFTVFATWFGAETCIGAAGAVYERGLAGGSADPFGYALCVILTGLIFAVPLWRLRLTTLADLFRLRFGASVERLAVVLMVPTSLLWAAAQVRAFGQVLSSASGFQIEATVAIAGAVVIAYTMFGGLLADAWTDLVQGIALIVGLAVLCWMVVAREGVDLFTTLDPTVLDPLGTEPKPLLGIVEEWAVPVVGSMIAAELVARILATRSARIARNATVAGGVAYFVVGLAPVALGLVGASLLPGLAEPEQVLPSLARAYLPTVLFVLFAGGLVSAILSTVDSALLMAAGLVSHNVIVQVRPGLEERAKVRLARACVAAFGVLAYVLALRAERVYELVEEASAFGSAGIVTVVSFGLFTRIGGRASAIAALLAGVTTWILGEHLVGLPYPYLSSLAAAFAAYLLAAAMGSTPTHRLEPVPERSERGL